MDLIKKRIFESLNAADAETPAVIAQGKTSRVTTDPKDDQFVNVTDGQGVVRVSVGQLSPDMERLNGLEGPAREKAVDDLVSKYNHGPKGSSKGFTAPTPIGEAAKRKADAQNELASLFESSGGAKDNGTVRVSLVHNDLILIECSRLKLFDKLAKQAVVESPNPVNFSFYVSRANASVIAEALKKENVRIKNTIRKVSERKGPSSVRI